MNLPRIDYIDERADWSRGVWAWIGAGALLVLTIVFLQWFTRGLHSSQYATAPVWVRESESLDGVHYGELALAAKAYIKMRAHLQDHGADLGHDDEWDESSPSRFMRDEIDPIAVSRTQRLWAAVIAGELIGKSEALARLDALTKELTPGVGLAGDAEWFRVLYLDGAASLSDEARASLLARHRWFAQIAMSHGLESTDTYRRQALRGGKQIESLFGALALASGVMFLGGLVAGALLIRRMHAATFSLHEVVSGAPEFLQAFVLLLGLFTIVLGLSLLPFGMGVEGTVGAVIFHAALPWILCATFAWPIIRGLERSRAFEHMGLHTGEGVGKEVGIGAMAFLAELPLGIAISLVVGLFSSASSGEPTGTPIMDSPPTDNGLVVFLWALGAVVWAPIVEEIAFRGQLYGFLRARLDVFTSVLISAALFGLIHPYSPAGMIQVAASGVVYALLREWRGSLIAPMTAHALHNGMLVFIEMQLTRTIGG